MSPDRLREFSRKELENLARRQGVPNIRQLRKQDLIEALVSPTKSPSAVQGAAAAKDVQLRSSKASPQHRTGAYRSGGARRTVHGPGERPADHDALHVQVVDDAWLRISWQVTPATRDRAEAALGPDWHAAVPVLQLTDVTPNDDGDAADQSTDYTLQPGAPVWFVRVPNTDATYRIALGYRSPGGRFHLMLRSRPLIPSRLRSNAVESTVAALSPTAAGPRLGNGESPDVAAALPESFGGLHVRFADRSSDSSARIPLPSVGVPRLGVELELLVHGMTDGDAELTLMSKPLSLSRDGRFQHRLPLVAGRQVVPIVSTSGDGTGERTVVIALDLSTRELEPRVFDETW